MEPVEKVLLEKLLIIKESVEFLKKETEGQGFKFTPSSQVLMSVRDEMNKQKVLLIPKVTGTTFHHKAHNGEKMHHTEIHMTMTWKCVETLEELECPWYGQGCDQHEKGVGKAFTYAEKYFILKFFNIPTDKDDPDYGHGSKGKTTGSRKRQNGTPPDASKKQWEFLKKLGKKAHLDDEDFKAFVIWSQDGRPPKELNIKQASELIDNFDTVLGQFLDGKAKEDE